MGPFSAVYITWKNGEVSSKEDLGEASQTKRPTSIVLVTCGADFKESYDELASELAAIAPSWR